MSLQNVSLKQRKIIIIVCGCLLLIGCAGVISKSDPSEEASFFIQQSMELKSGMRRADVHLMVGSPYVSSESLKFDIFQNKGMLTEYVGIPPIPIPFFGYMTQEYIPILFVTYNDNWTVKSYEWDIYRESGISKRKNVLMELDGYTLVRSDSNLTGMMLFAPAEVSEQELLKPLLSDQCVLYLIAPDQPIEQVENQYYSGLTKLFINDKLVLNFSGFPYSRHLLHTYYWLGVISDTVYIGFELPEGVHELELSGHVKEDSIIGRFKCVAGKANFANIRTDIIDVWSEKGWTLGYRYRVKGEIFISDNWPKENIGRRQILMYRDTWYGLEYQK